MQINENFSDCIRQLWRKARKFYRTVLIALVIYALAGLVVHHSAIPDSFLECFDPKYIFGGFVCVISILLLLYQQCVKGRTRYRSCKTIAHIILGVVVLLICDAGFRIIIFPETPTEIGGWYPWGALLGALFLTVFLILVRLSPQKKKQLTQDTSHVLSDLETESIGNILKWVNDDRPIDNLSRDYFHFHPIAKRISEEFKKRMDKNENFVVGLLGPFGAGKSSIANLVDQYLISDKTIFTAISCWGFEKSETALREMLEKIIEKLDEKGIETEEIHRIPDNYISALKKTNTLVGSFLDFFLENPNRTPETVLKKLETLLSDNKIQMLLVVEDFDRNENKSFDMAEFLASLMWLKKLKNVFLIISGQPFGEAHNVDYHKLCDRIEVLPSINSGTASIIFEKLAHYHTMEQYPEDIPLAVSHFTDLSSDDCDPSFSSFGWEFFVVFLKQPRVFKHVIRDLHAAWERLHGECSYIELMAFSILKHGAPRVFGFIRNNIHLLKNPHDNSIRVLSEFITGFEKSTEMESTIIGGIFATLFPNVANALQQKKLSVSKKSRRVFNSSPMDYYDRITSEMIIQEESDRDQALLRAIYFWNSRKDHKLVELLANANSNNKHLLERWLEQINDLSLLELTELVVKKIFTDALSRAQKPTGQEAGILILQHQWYSFRTKLFNEHFPNWFDRFFRMFLPESMNFALQFYYRFCCTWENVKENGTLNFYGIHPEGAFESTRKLFVECVRQAYSTPEAIVRACFGESIDVIEEIRALWLLVRVISQKQSEGRSGTRDEHSRAADCQWIAEILIAGLESDDQIQRTKIYALVDYLVIDVLHTPQN